jgi:DNA gyrase subunit A
MPEHWRLGVVERHVLEALDRIGAGPDRPHRRCADIVQVLADEFGVNPRYGYDSLCTLAQPWLLHVPLVDFHGNCGSADAGDHPAHPRYTEARLASAGALALAAERGDGPPVPVTLINGNLHVDGTAPPYSPRRVIDTLLSLVDDPRVSDQEIIDRVGPPESPTGCGVGCDDRALAAGGGVGMILTAQLSQARGERGQPIVLTNLPLGIGSDTVVQALASRATAGRRNRGSQEFGQLGLQLREVRDESSGNGTRIVCEVPDDADVARVEFQIASTWGVTTRHQAQLAAPLAQLVRELLDNDPAAQRATLDALSRTL